MNFKGLNSAGKKLLVELEGREDFSNPKKMRASDETIPNFYSENVKTQNLALA